MEDISALNQGIRINKFLSEAGVCSRREADKMTAAGRVYIAGKLAAAGSRVFPGQKVTVDGKTVSKEEEEIYIAFYKPKGIVCTTASTENGSKVVNVVDYIGYNKRIYPIGRLDQSSEGLLLLTNQGGTMEKILRSRYGHEKEYFVRTASKITDSFIKGMASGVPVLDTVTKPCKVWKEDDYSFHIILTQGLNRQIRRMCEYFGYRVVYLRRDRVMNITLDGLKKGRYRHLSDEEITELKRQANINQGGSPT
ncbi:MAG TPA: 23S rRNA pseudouridine synthase F [Lachnospiraceae bacterium]|nr:23S rRNA pseudouridine synthase F [Lachnospiraceae bacterium]